MSSDNIPAGVKLASNWAWRLASIAVGILIIGFLLQKFMLISLPIFVALLLASLGVPATNYLERWMPRWLAAMLVLLGGVGALGALGYFVVKQVIANSSDLVDKIIAGIDHIEEWLIEGPLSLEEKQISDSLAALQDFIQSKSELLVSSATATVGTVGNLAAGGLVALFAFYFFMKDGAQIWQWIVKIFPQSSRGKVDSSGAVAWSALEKYTHATVLVALVDSIGIMLVAWLLDIPMVLPIGVLVFLGSFVPMVGGLITGIIPVLIGLVVGGPTTALFMLIGVVAVQQIEGNVLQPFLMGKFVSIHPLAILLAISAGFIVAGIPGALVAVPFVACVNAVCVHLASGVSYEEFENEGINPPDPIGPVNQSVGKLLRPSATVQVSRKK